MKRAALTALLALSIPAFASPSIETVTATPSPAKVGQAVKVTINAKDATDGICGLDVWWGDGNRDKPRRMGGQHEAFPITVEHTYSKPGTYTIKANGKRAGSYLGCPGEGTTNLTVEAVAAVAATPAAAAKAACPTDWALKGKAAKDGSYTCSPKKKGAAKPEKAIDCPAGTSYFMSSKALGCEKAN
jgi:hypothetical protein